MKCEESHSHSATTDREAAEKVRKGFGRVALVMILAK